MKKRICLLLAMLCLFCLAGAALAEETEGPVLILDETEATVYKGKTFKLAYTIEGAEDPSGPKVVWSSSDETVAAVQNGTVTGKNAGTATVTCTVTLKDGTELTAACEVEVGIAVTGIRFTVNALTVRIGEPGEEAEYTVQPADASCTTVTWSSSDESIATVDENGAVTGLKPGRVTVTAVSDADATKKAVLNVTVIQPVLSITLDQESGECAKGKTVKLTATVGPDDATDKRLTWTSSDPNVASVANGMVTARAPGKATIICAAADGSGTEAAYEIEVFAPVTAVKIEPANPKAFVGGEPLQLSAVVTPDDAKYKTVTWSCSDESIATVDENGAVTAVKAGRANITAVSDSDPTKKATVTVTVMQPVLSITLDQESGECAKGKTVKLTATVGPDDATDKRLTWTSSDPNVASVANGTVTARAPGKATIICAAADGSGTEAAYEIEVFAPVTAVKIEPANPKVFVGGEPLQLSAVVTPDDAKYKTVTWSCSDESIATVDENGTVTAVKAGRVTVTVVSDSDPTKKATVNVDVMQPVRSITLSGTASRIAKGKSVRLTATVGPDDATDKKLIWTSSNPKVATVANGTVTARQCGSTTITCEAADGSGVKASYSFAVIQEVTGIRFNSQRVAVGEGGTVRLSVTVSPKDATNKKVTWSSSNPSVASVDSNGVVTGKKGGQVTITATAQDGSGKSASVTVYVEPRIPLDATKFTRSGYFGMYYEFAVTFKNMTKTRTVKYIAFRLEYTYNGKTYSGNFYTDSDTIRPGATKKVGWWDIGYQLTYASNFKVYLTSVKYSDGTWDYFSSNNMIGWFY